MTNKIYTVASLVYQRSKVVFIVQTTRAIVKQNEEAVKQEKVNYFNGLVRVTRKRTNVELAKFCDTYGPFEPKDFYWDLNYTDIPDESAAYAEVLRLIDLYKDAGFIILNRSIKDKGKYVQSINPN